MATKDKDSLPPEKWWEDYGGDNETKHTSVVEPKRCFVQGTAAYTAITRKQQMITLELRDAWGRQLAGEDTSAVKVDCYLVPLRCRPSQLIRQQSDPGPTTPAGRIEPGASGPTQPALGRSRSLREGHGEEEEEGAGGSALRLEAIESPEALEKCAPEGMVVATCSHGQGGAFDLSFKLMEDIPHLLYIWVDGELIPACPRTINVLAGAAGESKQQEVHLICNICNDTPPNTIILPCGHLGLCSRCAGELARRKEKCPWCRAEVSGRRRAELKVRSASQKKLISAKVEDDVCLDCHWCEKNTMNILLAPCSHVGLCATCAPKATHCPFCQEKVLGRIKVFIEAQKE